VSARHAGLRPPAVQSASKARGEGRSIALWTPKGLRSASITVWHHVDPGPSFRSSKIAPTTKKTPVTSRHLGTVMDVTVASRPDPERDQPEDQAARRRTAL
jgi:hypothetical protein